MSFEYDKSIFRGIPELLNISTSAHTTLMTTSASEDTDTFLIVVILVACIVGALFISAVAATVYCHRKKVLCFSKPNQKTTQDTDTYVLSISQNVAHLDDPQTLNTMYDNYAVEAHRLQNLNSAWYEPSEHPASNLHRFSPIYHSSENGVTNEFGNNISCYTNTREYGEENNTFSPMKGFVSSLLSRYERDESKRSEINNGVSISGDDDEFQCSEEMKDQGSCSVKTNFNPNTFQYKSTPGLLKIATGEKLLVLQSDLGSGWTCVRNPKTLETGFVPTRNLYTS